MQAPPEDIPYLIYLREGPSHSVADAQPVCEALSRRFHGEMWTYGSHETDTVIGRFRLRVLNTDNRNQRLAYLGYMRQVRRRARELAASGRKNVVVISYDPFKNGLLASMVARITGGKFICEVNGSYANPDNFADLTSPLKRRFMLRAMRAMASYVVRRADGIKLLFDDALEGLAKPRVGATIRRYPNLAYLTRFYSLPEEKFILLVGFPFYRKGADILCNAFISIADRFPEWRVVLIGHQLAAAAEKIGLRHERIQFLAGMKQDDVANWMARCAILAQPSRSEAMGRVLLEGAAAGKCRVGSNIEGIPTVITDGVDGALARTNDPKDLARVLEELMNDRARRDAFGAAARRRAETEFSPEHYLANLGELVEAVTKKPANAIAETPLGSRS